MRGVFYFKGRITNFPTTMLPNDGRRVSRAIKRLAVPVGIGRMRAR